MLNTGTANMNRRSIRMIRTMLTVMLAVMLLAGTALLPGGFSHAGGLDSATLPKEYQSGYNVYKCIDISNHQGVISKADFTALRQKHGITHVIVRVGYTGRNFKLFFGRWADAAYKENIDNAYAAGLKVGAYYYSQAVTLKRAKKEAEKTIKLLANYKNKITMPVAFDWEFNSNNRDLTRTAAAKNGKELNTRICSTYCDMIKEAGYTPMIYSSASVFTGYLNRDTLHSKYKIWVAHYTGGKATDYSKPMYMWQFSSSAKFSQNGRSLTGNTSVVDINYLFIKKTGQWVAFANGKYKYKEDGVFLKSQWLTLGENTYYLDADGYRVTGYQQIGKYFYGFSPDGIMYKKATVDIDGKTYRFLANGYALLYKAKVVNVSDGRLAYRTNASLTKGSTVGYYALGEKIKVVRTKGDWVQASNGYWSLSTEDGTDYLEITKTFPVEQE